MINIFRVDKVVDDELYDSWCYNVITNSDDQCLPINKEGKPMLRLQSKDCNLNYFIGVIPILKDWSRIDLTKYNNLYFAISSFDNINIGITLTTVTIDGKEDDSKELFIKDYGANAYSIQNYVINLNDFECNLHSVRFIKFIGHGNFTFYLNDLCIL